MHSEGEVHSLFDAFKKDFDRLDILVNNAGINRPRDLFSTDVWKEVFQVNLFSAVLCTEKAIQLMNGSGKIVNISSIYAEGKACWIRWGAGSSGSSATFSCLRMLGKSDDIIL